MVTTVDNGLDFQRPLVYAFETPRNDAEPAAPIVRTLAAARDAWDDVGEAPTALELLQSGKLPGDMTWTDVRRERWSFVDVQTIPIDFFFAHFRIQWKHVFDLDPHAPANERVSASNLLLGPWGAQLNPHIARNIALYWSDIPFLTKEVVVRFNRPFAWWRDTLGGNDVFLQHLRLTPDDLRRLGWKSMERAVQPRVHSRPIQL